MINGQASSALDVSSQIIFPLWKRQEDEHDMTAMRVVVSGTSKEGKEATHTYELIDYFDPKTNTTSMARTTGYTAVAGVYLLTRNIITSPGLYAPEQVGVDIKACSFVEEHLNAMGVNWSENKSSKS